MELAENQKPREEQTLAQTGYSRGTFSSTNDGIRADTWRHGNRKQVPCQPENILQMEKKMGWDMAKLDGAKPPAAQFTTEAERKGIAAYSAAVEAVSLDRSADGVSTVDRARWILGELWRIQADSGKA